MKNEHDATTEAILSAVYTEAGAADAARERGDATAARAHFQEACRACTNARQWAELHGSDFQRRVIREVAWLLIQMADRWMETP